MADDTKTPYERAVELVKMRPSVSARNLETALGISSASAKSFIRIMREDGIVSGPQGNLARHQVLVYSPPENAGLPMIDPENPQDSVLYGQDMPIDDILSPEAQKKLRIIAEFIIAEEDKISVIREGVTAAYSTAKILGIHRDALKPVIKAIRKNNVSGLKATINCIEIYLHALGEIVEDTPEPGPSVFQNGGGSGTKH